ncbi:Chemotaxis protein methyltransferase [subsurface metagenome]
MSSEIQTDFTGKKMSEKDFDRLSRFIHTRYGIKMPPAKRIMLESRLQKRLRKLEFSSFHDYIEYVLSQEGKEHELIQMIDLVTTNKTDFFREPAHFDFLVETALPELINLYQAGIRSVFKVWSAGCSTGEEPYTLAIVLSEFAETRPHFHFSILATDISSRVLEYGKEGIYEAEKVEPIPKNLKKKYLLRGKDKNKNLVRIKPELRKPIRFYCLNLMDSRYTMLETMDIVFFRNVIIYFDRSTQEMLINRVCRYLKPGGFIFMGHSETLFSMNVPLDQAAPTIYRRN